MSRLAKKPLILPSDVTVETSGRRVTVTGPKGRLIRDLPLNVQVSVGPKSVTIGHADPALAGLSFRLVAGMIEGVHQGWQKKIELSGIGFRVEMKGSELVFSLGFTHPVTVAIPPGLEIKIEKSVVTIAGHDKEQVGQFAAHLRSLKPPEPYKGKGIRYAAEVIKLKPGKQVKGATGPAK